MFDKRVTPSDVGKLHGLVISKQQAEENFQFLCLLPSPIPTSAPRTKSMLHSLKDRTGKVWRSWYSLWYSNHLTVGAHCHESALPELMDMCVVEHHERLIGDLEAIHVLIVLPIPGRRVS